MKAPNTQMKGIDMLPEFRSFELGQSSRSRLLWMLVSLPLLSFFSHADAAATPVPSQLYGKSVTSSRAMQQTLANETNGKTIIVNTERTDSFYFSTQGRIFTRYSVRNQFGSRTFEQVGSDPKKVQAGLGGSVGTSAGSFQDIHFEGRTLVAIQKVGDNGARKMAIEFDDKFRSCAVSRVTGTENAKPIRKIGWAGHVERIISEHTTSTSGCLIQDGNIFER
jgi:hypothetical protein